MEVQKPIFTNEFDVPREPPRIKQLIKVGHKGRYLGIEYIVTAVDGELADLNYADSTGVIHQLSVPLAVL